MIVPIVTRIDSLSVLDRFIKISEQTDVWALRKWMVQSTDSDFMLVQAFIEADDMICMVYAMQSYSCMADCPKFPRRADAEALFSQAETADLMTMTNLVLNNAIQSE